MPVIPPELPAPKIIERKRIREPTFDIPPPRQQPKLAWIRGIAFAGISIVIAVIAPVLPTAVQWGLLALFAAVALFTVVEALLLYKPDPELSPRTSAAPTIDDGAGCLGSVLAGIGALLLFGIVIAIVLALPIKVLLGLILLALL